MQAPGVHGATVDAGVCRLHAAIRVNFDSTARPGVRRRMSREDTGCTPTSKQDIMKSPSSDITRDPRWTSIVTRDKAADGSFWYSVATTGIFCRPSCPSRRANPKNVRLHETPARPRPPGFRPCRRCNPDGHLHRRCKRRHRHQGLPAHRRGGRAARRWRSWPSSSSSARTTSTASSRKPRGSRRKPTRRPPVRPAARRGWQRQRRSPRRSHEAGFSSNGRFYEASAACWA